MEKLLTFRPMRPMKGGAPKPTTKPTVGLAGSFPTGRNGRPVVMLAWLGRRLTCGVYHIAARRMPQAASVPPVDTTLQCGAQSGPAISQSETQGIP